MKTAARRNRLGENLLIVLVGVPVLGVLMGGLYSLPSIRLTKGREPWLTLLLVGGLSVSVFGIGSLLRGTISLAYVWAFGVALLLLVRRAYGNLGNNLERFGLVHGAVLVLTVIVALHAHG